VPGYHDLGCARGFGEERDALPDAPRAQDQDAVTLTDLPRIYGFGADRHGLGQGRDLGI
jgi:hypothetical protein